jgi:hypothetical protein
MHAETEELWGCRDVFAAINGIGWDPSAGILKTWSGGALLNAVSIW